MLESSFIAPLKSASTSFPLKIPNHKRQKEKLQVAPHVLPPFTPLFRLITLTSPTAPHHPPHPLYRHWSIRVDIKVPRKTPSYSGFVNRDKCLQAVTPCVEYAGGVLLSDEVRIKLQMLCDNSQALQLSSISVWERLYPVLLAALSAARLQESALLC